MQTASGEIEIDEGLISHEKFNVFPLSKVKKIAQLNPDLVQISSEAVIALEKAAELFLQDFTQTSIQIAKKHHRKTLQVKDMK